ncbi:hypothetical protein Rsub_06797 [Raphidocelis subcapitata]|uniref:Uncharacterized protein n=1 Tax=Raphidocelis subcapitata TaxID=307507 RepID=A0A2V0P1F3_9CHLO|nr:hypothetical protein Rsub_06797 [Raphidocelis subcapitata]|eukprot:GBF93694.1 hypothetical protein Rsub_06797 [Raphidocelis subcapitata]
MDGRCVADDTACTIVTGCGRDWDCPDGQCCNKLTGLCSTAIVVGGKQVCDDCKSAIDRGMKCPNKQSVCCAAPEGSRACAATEADCAGQIGGKDVAKYQAFHLLFLQLYANGSMAMDDAIFRTGDYNRPDLSGFRDFRAYVEKPWTENECNNRGDPSIGAHGGAFIGLDFATAPKPLLTAFDAAAQFWWEECTMLKAWWILAYLQQAPGGRYLLCPPRHFWGFAYQMFHRNPDPNQPLFGLHNWPLLLNPVNIFLNGTDKPVNMLNLMTRAQQLKWYLPEPMLAMEGLIELLISHDHSLPLWTTTLTNATVTSARITAVSGPSPDGTGVDGGAWTATADRGREGWSAATMSALLQSMSEVGQMDEGPQPPDWYATYGHVVGLLNPEALKRHPHLPSLYGCESSDVQCAADSRRNAGSEGALDGRAASFSDMATVMSSDDDCLGRIRSAFETANKADTLCKVRLDAGKRNGCFVA